MAILDITVGRTAEEGARQLLWAALGPDGKDGEHVKHLRGAYVSTFEVREPSDFVVSKEGYETQERIWVSIHARIVIEWDSFWFSEGNNRHLDEGIS
jgi:retinol dehydrogenase 12